MKIVVRTGPGFFVVSPSCCQCPTTISNKGLPARPQSNLLAHTESWIACMEGKESAQKEQGICINEVQVVQSSIQLWGVWIVVSFHSVGFATNISESGDRWRWLLGTIVLQVLIIVAGASKLYNEVELRSLVVCSLIWRMLIMAYGVDLCWEYSWCNFCKMKKMSIVGGLIVGGFTVDERRKEADKVVEECVRGGM